MNTASKFRPFISKNPYTGQTLKEFKFISDAELTHKIEQSHQGFLQYKQTSFKERSNKLLQLATNVEQNSKYYAEILAEEIGKPIKQGEAEVLKSAAHCKFYAQNLEKFLKQTRIKTEAKNSGVIYQPLGVIHLMIPFNFPFWLTFKSGIPMLSAGNTVLMRNSDSSPIIAEELEKLFIKSGFSNNEFLNVYSKGEQLDLILSNKRVQGVSFTGSTAAGRNIASIAGKHLKKSIMELGGSDPFIVLLDADVDLAVSMAVTSRLNNNGQVCISAKRFLIHDNVYELFKEKLIEKVETMKQGDPLEQTTELGPMARIDLKENVEKQVEQGIQQGATVLYKRDTSEFPNTFYGPVILEITDKNNILFQEELFGPVFSLYRIQSEQEAVEIANDSEYGLGASIYSKNEKNAEQLARQIDSGSVFINHMVKSDSRLPSGGCKSSGYGRECGEEGIHEFVNAKAYYIA